MWLTVETLSHQNTLKDLPVTWDPNHRIAIVMMRVDKKIWWFIMSRAADMSRGMRIQALASHEDSVTNSEAASVKRPLLKPDWLEVLLWEEKKKLPDWNLLPQVLMPWTWGERQVWSFLLLWSLGCFLNQCGLNVVGKMPVRMWSVQMWAGRAQRLQHQGHGFNSKGMHELMEWMS